MGRLHESTASWLARCTDPAVRDELFQQVLRGALTRDQVKAAVQKGNGGARKYIKKFPTDKFTLKHKSGVVIRIDGGDLSAIRTALGWASRRSNAVEDLAQLEDGE